MKCWCPLKSLNLGWAEEMGFARENRFENPRLAPDERVISFCRIVHDLDEKAAVAESHRCLQCDLRLKMTPVKFWGDY